MCLHDQRLRERGQRGKRVLAFLEGISVAYKIHRTVGTVIVMRACICKYSEWKSWSRSCEIYLHSEWNLFSNGDRAFTGVPATTSGSV